MSKNMCSLTDVQNQNVSFLKPDANACVIKVLTECKIKLIFTGFDEFLNKHESFDLKFDLSISEIDDTKWTGENPTRLDNFPVTTWKEYESNRLKLGDGYQIDLGNQNKFKKSKYKLTLLDEESLFGIKEVFIIKGIQGTTVNNIQETLKFDFDDNSFIIDKSYFQNKYFHKVDGDIKSEDKYLYIKISFYMKLKLRFNLQGASEDYLYQGTDKKSLVIPMSDKSDNYQYYDETKESTKKKKPKDYETFYDLLDGDNFLLERDFTNKMFKKFNSDSSVGFKAVNYRKYVYKGDENNFLDGDNSFKTDIETDKYFHTESIQSIVFILVESNEKKYLFEHNNIIGTFSMTKKTKLDELDSYKDVYKTKYKEIQFIFLKFKFDGKLMRLEKVLIDKKECS